MSRSGSESRSPSKRHSRNREAAVAAIIDSLYGTTTPGPDSPDQATESTLPHLGTDAAAHAAELTAPTALPHSEVDPTVESPAPPPPPPPSVSDESANPRMPPPVATAKPPPPPPSSAQENPAVAAADVPPPPPPPTPQAEPVVEPPAKVKVDYASSSAMVKDILSADRQQGSDENAPTDMGPEQDSVSIDRLPDAPVSSDFFTSAKQKKRRWRPR